MALSADVIGETLGLAVSRQSVGSGVAGTVQKPLGTDRGFRVDSGGAGRRPALLSPTEQPQQTAQRECGRRCPQPLGH